jgi:hypothetical protein
MLRQGDYTEPTTHGYLRITDLYNDFSLGTGGEEYSTFLGLYKNQIVQYYMSRQRSSGLEDMSDGGITLAVIQTVKAIILFRKHNRGNYLRSNIVGNVAYSTMDEFISKNQYFCLKENFICSGCDVFLNKSQTKLLSNFEGYYICDTCAEIYCE